MHITVFGGGSWGTALAHHAARCGHAVLLWTREAEVAEGIRRVHRNPLFQSDLDLHPAVDATADLDAAARFSRVWLWVVPVPHTAVMMQSLGGSRPPDVVLVSASKGIERHALRRVDQLATQVLGIEERQFCALSGPTFAREVLLGRPSAAVLAGSQVGTVEHLQRELSDEHLRLYTSTDVIGVELAGALKNVVAIAAGVVEGLDLGPNSLAALATRGLHEITRLAVRAGADPDTFRGLAGMGDLMLTCTSGQSRNRTVGWRLGRGEPIEDVVGGMREVAEGVLTAEAACELAERYGVEMPITEAVARLLAGEAEPKTVVRELMLRGLKEEARL